MADNLSITVSADVTKLTANLALAKEAMRSYGAEIRKLAQAGAQATDPQFNRIAGQLAAAAAAARNYGKELKEATQPQGGGLANMFKEAGEAASGLTARFGAVKGAMTEIAEAAGVAFAVEKVGEWMAKTAEAGERAVNLAAAVGMPTQKYLEFAGALRMAGGDADAASRTLERLARNTGDALNNSNSRAAMAFKALGISMVEVRKTGGDAEEMLKLIIAAANQFAPTMSRTAAVMALTGRGMNEIAGLLRAGAAGYEENKAKVRELGSAIQQYADEQADSAEKVRTLRDANTGLSNELFHDLKPAFDGALTNLTQFSNELRLGAKWANDFTAAVGGISGVLKGIGNVELNIGMPGLITGAMTGDWKKMLFGPFGHAFDDPKPKEFVFPLNPGIDVTAKKTAPWMDKAGSGNEAYQAFAEGERLKIAEAQGAVDKIEAIYAEWLAEAKRVYGEASKQYREVQLSLVNFEKEAQAKRFAMAQEGVSAQQHADADILKGFEARMQAMVDHRQLTPEQALGFDAQEVYRQADEQKARLDELMSSAKTPEQMTSAYWKQWTLGIDVKAKIDEINKKIADAGKAAAEAYAAPFRGVFDKLGSSLETALTNIILHKPGENLRKQLFEGMVSSGVGIVGGAFSKGTASLIPGSKPGQGLGDVLGDKLGAWISQAVAQTAAAIANTTAVTANTAALATSAGASAAGGVGSAVGGAGGFLGFIGSLFGSGGSGIAGAAGKLGMIAAAKGGWYDVHVPSYAGGGWSIPDGLAMLHQHEMVIPADKAAGLRNLIDNGGAGGGVTHHWHMQFNGPVNDAPGVTNMLHANKRAIQAMVMQKMPKWAR